MSSWLSALNTGHVSSQSKFEEKGTSTVPSDRWWYRGPTVQNTQRHLPRKWQSRHSYSDFCDSNLPALHRRPSPAAPAHQGHVDVMPLVVVHLQETLEDTHDQLGWGQARVRGHWKSWIALGLPTLSLLAPVGVILAAWGLEQGLRRSGFGPGK